MSFEFAVKFDFESCIAQGAVWQFTVICKFFFLTWLSINACAVLKSHFWQFRELVFVQNFLTVFLHQRINQTENRLTVFSAISVDWVDSTMKNVQSWCCYSHSYKAFGIQSCSSTYNFLQKLPLLNSYKVFL
jgi:hypothetical protein